MDTTAQIRRGARLVAGLILAMNFARAADAPTDFRMSRWGDSKAEVMAREPSPVAAEKDDLVLYDTNVAGLDGSLGYVFAGGKLVRANYVFEINPPTDQNGIEEYSKVRVILASKYGAPSDEEKVWKNSLDKKPESGRSGNAVAQGQLVYKAQWITKPTEIVEWLEGGSSGVTLRVQYRSVEYGHLEDAEKDRRNNRDF